MTRARRILAVVLIAAGGLVALAVLLAAFVVFTTPGARLALSVANRRDLPVRVGAVEGTLARRFVLHDVALQLGSVQATIDTVTVAWRPSLLKDRRLYVEELGLIRARVLVASGAPDTTAAETAVADEDSTRDWSIVADRVRVRDSTLDAPGNVHLHDIDVTGGGELDGYRADVRASGSVWRFADVRAFVRASGNTHAAAADSLDIRTLGGVVQGDAFVRWDPAVSWRGRLRGDSLSVGELSRTPEEWLGAVSFAVRSTGSLGASTRVGIDVESLQGTLRERPISAHGRVAIDGARIQASDAQVRWGSAHASLAGSMADTANVTIDARIPVLAEILPRARGSAAVRGTITGTPERIDVDVVASAHDVRAGRFAFPVFDATVEATLDANDYVPYRAQVRRGDIRTGDGTLDARGTVAWRDGTEWDATLRSNHFEVSTLAPSRWNLYGPISIDATTSGVRRGNRLHGRVQLQSLAGTLRDRAVSGTGGIALERDGLRVSALRLAWGDLRVAADGQAGDTLGIDFDVTAPNLAWIDTSLAGSVAVSGRAHGTRKQPGVAATFACDSVRVRAYGVRHLEGNVDADLAFATPMDVRVLAIGVSRGDTVLDTLSVVASGPRAAHRARVSVARGDARASATVSGAYSDTTWTGWIDDVRVRTGAVGEWVTSGRAPALYSPNRARVDSLSLASGRARFSASADWQRGDTTRVRAEVRGFDLAILERHAVAGMKITGTLDGTVAGSLAPDGRIYASVDMTPGPGEIAYADKRVSYQGRASGRADARGVFARVDLDFEQAGAALATVDGEASIAGFVWGRDSLSTQPVAGRFDLDCRDIAPLLAALAPSLTNAAGALAVHVTPRGTAGNFRLDGTAALADARCDLPSGARIRNAEFSLVSDGSGRVTLEGAANSGGGRVTIQAASVRSEKGWLNGTFTAKGERFELINQPDARLFVSPNLDVRLEERFARVTGSVFVPFARIETTHVPSTATTPSTDVVFVEDTLATHRPALRVQTSVRVELGDSVTFNGFGLRGRLAGSLTVDDETGRPTQGTGEIQIVDGKYRAFGNELTIDPGRFVFGGGAIENPGLDVRAYRGLTTQNVMAGSSEMVGVNLRGTLQKPEMTVFSNPPMSESEILSYLVMGRSSTGSSGEQSALANAALLLGMQQGTSVAGDLGKKLDLDDAYIDAGTDVNETSIVAGKYLSPKLYISYTAGLFEHTNVFRARYSLTNKWTLQAESGTKANSSDILYWFEKGK